MVAVAPIDELLEVGRGLEVGDALEGEVLALNAGHVDGGDRQEIPAAEDAVPGRGQDEDGGGLTNNRGTFY